MILRQRLGLIHAVNNLVSLVLRVLSLESDEVELCGVARKGIWKIHRDGCNGLKLGVSRLVLHDAIRVFHQIPLLHGGHVVRIGKVNVLPVQEPFIRLCVCVFFQFVSFGCTESGQ